MKKSRIVIVVSGGVVQAVYSANQGIEVLLVDWDDINERMLGQDFDRPGDAMRAETLPVLPLGEMTTGTEAAVRAWRGQ